MFSRWFFVTCAPLAYIITTALLFAPLDALHTQFKYLTRIRNKIPLFKTLDAKQAKIDCSKFGCKDGSVHLGRSAQQCSNYLFCKKCPSRSLSANPFEFCNNFPPDPNLRVITMGMFLNGGPVTEGDKTSPKNEKVSKWMWFKMLFSSLRRKKEKTENWDFEDDAEDNDEGVAEFDDEENELGFMPNMYLEMGHSGNISFFSPNAFVSLTQDDDEDEYEDEEDGEGKMAQLSENNQQAPDKDAEGRAIDFVEPGKNRFWRFVGDPRLGLNSLSACDTVVSTQTISLVIDVFLTHAQVTGHTAPVAPIMLKGRFQDVSQLQSTSGGKHQQTCSQPFQIRSSVSRHRMLRLRLLTGVPAGVFRQLDAEALRSRFQEALSVTFRCASRRKRPCLINYYLSCVRISCFPPPKYKAQQAALLKRNAAAQPSLTHSVEKSMDAVLASLQQLRKQQLEKRASSPPVQLPASAPNAAQSISSSAEPSPIASHPMNPAASQTIPALRQSVLPPPSKQAIVAGWGQKYAAGRRSV